MCQCFNTVFNGVVKQCFSTGGSPKSGSQDRFECAKKDVIVV